MKKTLFIALLLISFIVSSCKKDEASKSKSEMLTGAKWNISSLKINGVAEVMEDCSKDDFIIFASGGTCTFNPGTIKCYSGEAIDTTIWSLSSDEKNFTLEGTTWTIVELTQSRFVISVKVEAAVLEMNLVAF